VKSLLLMAARKVKNHHHQAHWEKWKKLPGFSAELVAVQMVDDCCKDSPISRERVEKRNALLKISKLFTPQHKSFGRHI